MIFYLVTFHKLCYRKIMNTKSYTIKKFNFTKPISHTFDAGNFYEIFLISKGSCSFYLEETPSYCNTETAVFLKPKASVTMEFKGGKVPLELISIRVTPGFLTELSDESCDLARGFSFLPLEKTIIHLDIRGTTLIKNISKTVMNLDTSTELFGHELYEKNMLSILFILFLRSCAASDHVALSHQRKTLVMDDIFRYIREHLTEDLSLEVLEEQFFVSRHHLCREFKKLTGQTIHSYIVKSRLDLCKKYIEAGRPIKEVYELGGFGSYNHFFKAFKKEYDITPKEYYESLKE